MMHRGFRTPVWAAGQKKTAQSERSIIITAPAENLDFIMVYGFPPDASVMGAKTPAECCHLLWQAARLVTAKQTVMYRSSGRDQTRLVTTAAPAASPAAQKRPCARSFLCSWPTTTSKQTNSGIFPPTRDSISFSPLGRQGVVQCEHILP
eukprot:gene12145-biopygen6428